MHTAQTTSVDIIAVVTMAMKATDGLAQTQTNARLKRITVVQTHSVQTMSVHIIALVMMVMKATDGLAQT